MGYAASITQATAWFALPMVSTMPLELDVPRQRSAFNVGVYCWLVARMGNYNPPAAFVSWIQEDALLSRPIVIGAPDPHDTAAFPS